MFWDIQRCRIACDLGSRCGLACDATACDSGKKKALKQGKKRVYTTTVGPLFSRSVARPRGHRAKKAMVYTIFLGKQGKRVYTIGPKRRVYTIEPQTQKKKKRRVSTVVVYTFFFPVKHRNFIVRLVLGRPRVCPGDFILCADVRSGSRAKRSQHAKRGQRPMRQSASLLKNAVLAIHRYNNRL